MTPETSKVFEQLENVLAQLEKAIQVPVGNNRLEIDGTIQRFEFTIELFWKALKKNWLMIMALKHLVPSL